MRVGHSSISSTFCILLIENDLLVSYIMSYLLTCIWVTGLLETDVCE